MAAASFFVLSRLGNIVLRCPGQDHNTARSAEATSRQLSESEGATLTRVERIVDDQGNPVGEDDKAIDAANADGGGEAAVSRAVRPSRCSLWLSPSNLTALISLGTVVTGIIWVGVFYFWRLICQTSFPQKARRLRAQPKQ